MSNKKRPDYLNAFHHVLARGVAKQDIFSDARDYEYFLKKLGEYLKCKYVKCFAWVLMPNHFHLLVQRTIEPIHKFMQPFLTSYAMHYNNRHKRPGHLFQNRFKSILCQHDRYFLTLVKYIHQNPLRAGLVKNLDELRLFPWCGHAGLLGDNAFKWQDRNSVWQNFDTDVERSVQAYLELMQSDLSDEEMSNSRYGIIMKAKEGDWRRIASMSEKEKLHADVGILGDNYFISHALSKAAMCISNDDEDFEFTALTKQAADIFSIPVEMIFTKRRQAKVIQARSVICAWSVDIFQRTAEELSLRLDIHKRTAYRMVNNGRKLICSNSELMYKNVCKSARQSN